MHQPIGQLTLEMKAGDVETRGDEWGEIRVRTVDLPPGMDFTPLFKGLPGDLCQCPHWGYMTGGSLRLRYADGTEELTRAGDLYYWPPGHTGLTEEGTTFIEFSPAAEIRPVLQHLAAQMAG
ncbi:MAG: hypothetical protein WD830_10230 [Chloroflexota bacterium]